MKEHNYGLKERVFYGLADIYGGGAFIVITTFFTVFLTKALGMSPALAGTIPLIGKVWDAVTDPLMGNIVERTESKFGAKRFYMLVGSIISAITFVLMWINFKGDSGLGQYFFYVCMYMLFSTGFTIVMVPYNGLLPDMVSDYTIRSKFTGVRMFFSTLGCILAGIIPTLVIKDNTNASLYFGVAVLFGVIFAIVILATFFGTWETPKPAKKVGFKDSLVQSFTVYRSRSFKMFLGIFLFGQGAADFVTGLAVYYVDDVLNAYNGGKFTMLMGAILISQLLGTIIFTTIMAKTSKKFPIQVGFPVRIIATLVMLFFSYEGASFAIILALSFIVGLTMAASTVAIYAILSDMADVDELITTLYRPGICSGMATFIRKIATGLSSFIMGLLLTMVGYNETLANEGARQSAATQQGIAYIYIFAPIILSVCTLLVIKFFPLGKEEFEVIKKEVARRKGEDLSEATLEEIKICEKVTGFSYDKLWDEKNAYNFK